MWEGLALLAVSILSSPVPATPTGCVGGLAAIHVMHEAGHDLAAVAEGVAPWRPGALWGDKWSEEQSGYTTISRGGFVAQSWLVATTLDGCLAHGNTTHQIIYALRAKLSPDHAGDYGPVRYRGQLSAINVGLAAFLEGVAYEAHR